MKETNSRSGPVIYILHGCVSPRFMGDNPYMVSVVWNYFLSCRPILIKIPYYPLLCF